MVELIPFYRVAFLAAVNADQDAFRIKFIPKSEFVARFGDMLLIPPNLVDFNVFDSSIDEMIKEGLFSVISDDLTGVYIQLRLFESNNKFINEAKQEGSIAYKYARIGSTYLQRAILTITEPGKSEVAFETKGGEAPAADRVVTIDHNSRGLIQGDL